MGKKLTNKNQRHWLVANNGSEKVQTGTTYNWNYMYTTRPHAPADIGGVGYSYDTNGNQTGFVAPNVTRVIQWDEENRIRSVSDNGSTSDYVYDHTGERVIKRSSQGETAYVNQFYSVRNGSIMTKHVFAGTDRVATRVHTSRNNDLYFYHPDHLGSTNSLTDSTGEIYEHLEYFPFGETWVGERVTSNSTPFMFTSKELDEDTKLYYFGARYYDARTSVWQSADGAFRRGEYLLDLNNPSQSEEGFDPMTGLPGAGGVYNSRNFGIFTYSHQNPIKLSDPDGNLPTIAIGAIAGGIAGAGIGAFSAYMQGRDTQGILSGAAGGAISGAVTGALVGSGVGIVALVAGSAAGGAAGSVTENLLSLKSGEKVNPGKLAGDAAVDAVIGGVAAPLAGGSGKSAGNLAKNFVWNKGATNRIQQATGEQFKKSVLGTYSRGEAAKTGAAGAVETGINVLSDWLQDKIGPDVKE